MLLNPHKIKGENTRLLNEMEIPVMESLPHLDKPRFREPKDVATRSVILAALLQLHFGAPNEYIENYLQSNSLLGGLTDCERERLSRSYDEWPQQDKINLDWSMDAIWALMWCGGKHSNLSFNTCVEDSLASMLPAFETNEPADDCINHFKLFSKRAIFIELDKFYRVHWYARNNSLSGITDERVNLSIIMERRKALEWVCDANLDWEDISLDT
ncbi:DUF4272 domain-containing protein [Verrucomicrobiaceae bacterium 5K15]|uniref:DUF4272 domain-containing protein n=1 Tax=Oceaniferula flava TaxID=2800421 RepID=A0AAE2SBM3_9BACT|nr:DUF4272 domain-containing protein [Oceaniferula flavus]MBK1855241.1 DUF4272 domain-containing protein [Oceaniferula flavus]MBM1136547.1 DUF4272 domain-containing protein [Oceaniferula flavus]